MELLPDLARWQRESIAFTMAVVTRGSVDANTAKIAEHGLSQILLQPDREVAEAYQVYGTPSAVLVRIDGTIGAGVAQGAAQIRELVRSVLQPHALPALPVLNGNHVNGHRLPPAAVTSLPIGEPAPPLQLPDLDGRLVDLAGLKDSSTLVLFWNQGCGFCQRMLPDLKAWEANPPKGAPRLLVVANGTEEENRAIGLRSRVVLDQDFRAASAFGATGTPSAVLLDADGRVASGVMAGAPAVLALANSRLE
jgi:thiol-disulfide isomerase/thioredoxin